LRQTAQEPVVEALGQRAAHAQRLGPNAGRIDRALLELGLHRGSLDRLVVPRGAPVAPAGEREERQQPEGPHVVRRGRRAVAEAVLGRHPEQRRRALLGAEALAQPGVGPEVQHPRGEVSAEGLALDQHHGAGVEAAVGHAHRVDRVERLRHLPHDVEDIGLVEGLLRDPLGQRGPVVKADREPRRLRALIDARVEQLHHVRAAHARPRAAELGEALAPLGLRHELRVEHAEHTRSPGALLLHGVERAAGRRATEGAQHPPPAAKNPTDRNLSRLKCHRRREATTSALRFTRGEGMLCGGGCKP
jgi:hypothetical protein